MNENILNRVRGDQGKANVGNSSSGQEGAGRKELSDDQKSEKTLKNLESLG